MPERQTMTRRTTWLDQLRIARIAADDTEGDAILAPNAAAFNAEFYDGYGTAEGPPVAAWTRRRVYFPVTYDGAEWLDSAPRAPQENGQEHVGGQ